MAPPGIEPGPPDPETDALTTRPPRVKTEPRKHKKVMERNIGCDVTEALKGPYAVCQKCKSVSKLTKSVARYQRVSLRYS